jgi:hypothetical protein
MGKIKVYYWVNLVIYIAIIINILAYVLLVEFVMKRGDDPRSPLPLIIRYAPVIEVALTVIFISILKIFILTRAPANRPASSYIGRLFVISIISYILCEPIAVFGILNYIISGNKIDSYLVFVLVLFLMVFYFPHYSRWEKYIRSKTSIE